MTELARHADRPFVRRYDGFRYRQSHSRSSHKIALILPAVKFVENHSLLEIVNARTTVRHTDRHVITGKFRRNDNGLIFW